MRKNFKNYKLRETLIKVGISSNLKGFNFIQEAVEILQRQNRHINIMVVYGIIAKKYKVEDKTVHRLIRSAIKKAYKDNEGLKRIYEKSPSSSAFLNDLAFNFHVLQNNI